MSAPRLPEVDKAAIIAAYVAGEPSRAVAERFGVDPTYPRTLARRRGVAPRRADIAITMSRPGRLAKLTYVLPPDAWSQEEKARLAELAGQGATARQAAIALASEGFPPRTRAAMASMARQLGIAFVGGRRW
ncbi:hypothetical protein VQ042_18030 [Aurantimonas sp. A2-1-M11]|uniref:hypothetical protein n=1 Tax=Aurantimonas sp. A2-1-M11 TaxID=3113712 RepID=UPI002F94F221